MIKESIDSYIKADDPSAYTQVIDAANQSGKTGLLNQFCFVIGKVAILHILPLF